MRRQETGNRYLAGFVMAAAIIYLAITAAVSTMAWRDTSHGWLLTNLFALGFVPAIASIALGRRAWSASSMGSAGLSAVALVILLVAMTLWRLFVVSF